jgi:hypothetical protein
MADNVAITAGSGTTIAADDIGGALHQRVKISQGADGSGTDVSSAAPLQVTLANTGANTNKLLVTPDLPTGASTAAKQPALGTAGTASTDVVSVQGIASMTPVLATLSGTNNIATVTTVSAVTAISNALPAGNNNIGDVDIASIAAGNNNIGDVDIASIAAGDNNIGNVDIVTVPADPFGANADAASATGSISAKLRFISATGIPITSIAAGNNNIGDVDVASVVPGTGATNLGKAQDSAFGSTDTGVAPLYVRDDALSTITPAENDYALGRLNSRGAQWVTLDPTSAGIDNNVNAGEYETVAASQTAQVLGATGATGDYVSGLLVVPATTSPGNVLLLDNATSITVFTGGASSVSNLVPFFIPLGMVSVSGAWKVTTGANVSVIGVGNFT